MHRIRAVTALSVATVTFIACGNAGEDRLLGIEATGVVVGVVYFDGNGTRKLEEEDGGLAGVRVGLVVAGARDTIASVASGDQGAFILVEVPVGDYRVVVDTTTVGDSAIVARIDTAFINLRPNDTLSVAVAVSFPFVTVAQALALPIGEKVFVDGIALNARATFGDSTIHAADTSGTLRAVRAGPSSLFPGDSIRLRGSTATRDGRVVIDLDRDPPIVLAIAELPAPDTLTTAAAASAAGGILDAALVKIDSARITDTTTIDDDFVVTVDDGSGPLDVLLDKDVSFAPEPFLVPGADLEVSGLLVVTGTDTWRLKPRSEAEVKVTAPVVSVAAARIGLVGELVFVDGIALNNVAAFGDSTLHIADPSAAIRAIRTRPGSVFEGDSIRLIGTLAIRGGEPVLDRAKPFVLSASRLSPARRIPTDTAATAAEGALDAALVQVSNATISDTATVGGDFVLMVNDGSGVLEVVLDQDVGFLLAPFGPAVVIDATGLLVPTGSGAWQLKPRFTADVVVR